METPKELSNSEIRASTTPILEGADVKIDQNNHPKPENIPYTAPISVVQPVININRDGINIGEDQSMCCFCIEIKMGVFIIGIICCLFALSNTALALN